VHVGQDVTYMAYVSFVSPVIVISVWPLRMVTFTMLILHHPDNIQQTP